MATAKLNWMNNKGEVYELIVDELGNPVNFTLTPEDNVVINDADQKPIQILDPAIYQNEVVVGEEDSIVQPAEQPVVQTVAPQEPKPKKRGRPKKQP